MTEPIYGERFRPLPNLGKCMLLFDLQSKLSKLNPALYIKTDERAKNGADFWISGIYCKNPKRTAKIGTSGSLSEVTIDQQKYLQALHAGELDIFITGVCLNHIPEHDVFDLEKNSMLAPGWRKIALRLVTSKLCTLSRAKKIFNCSSLGEHDYDKMNFISRLRWAKQLAKKES